ncbi:MAG: thioredoxin-like protein [Monoraphidium minutum]|nr:MAG: thioredoxin-like protein [Monoraphidium minutum]
MCAMQSVASRSRPAIAHAPRRRCAPAAAQRAPLRPAPFGPALTGAPRRDARCRVLTESCDLAIGTKAPAFELPEPLTGKAVTLEGLAAGSSATLVMFLCVHCPFVVHLKGAISELVREYQSQGLAAVAISSNSTETHPQDGPDNIAKEARELGYPFPYLFDETQAVARAYKAACTPEFYLFGPDRGLVYHGAFDASTPRNNVPITGADLRAALDAVLAGRPVPQGRPSIGCNLKWSPGKEPEWYGPQQVQK